MDSSESGDAWGFEIFELSTEGTLWDATMQLNELGAQVRSHGEQFEREVTSRMLSNDPVELRLAIDNAEQIRDFMIVHDTQLQGVLQTINTTAPDSEMAAEAREFCENRADHLHGLADGAQGIIDWLYQRKRAIEDSR